MYFHQVDDPYSHLMIQVLPELKRQHDVHIEPWLVSPTAVSDESSRQFDYFRMDAERLAAKAGLDFQDSGYQPDSESVKRVAAEFQQHIDRGTFIGPAIESSNRLWRGQASEEQVPVNNPSRAIRYDRGDARRAALGHYMGATCFYEGEWYWGLDRLHHLQSRLYQEDSQPVNHIFKPANVPGIHGVELEPPPVIDVFISFRSTFSYIGLLRIKELADEWNAELRLKYVLPMAVRNVSSPRARFIQVLYDCAREARFHSIPFGRIADPAGKPMERGYSLLPWATAHNRCYEFCLSFLKNVWSQGVDAGSDKGLEKIVIEAGLDWREGRTQVGNEQWRAEAEAHQQELLDLGLWGTPSFRLDDTLAWGQDRLWLLEDVLAKKRPSAETL